MPGQWDNSGRRLTLTPEYFRLRPIVLRRDMHRCTWIDSIDDPDPIDSKNYGSSVVVHKIVEDSKTQMCGDTATDVDHIDGDEDSLTNLRSLCSYHHDKRSSRQGNKARWQHRNNRDREKHSGIRD